MLKYRGSALLKLYRETPSKIVRLTRTTKEMTQQDMANKLGIHRSVLSRYENGEYMPPGDILVRCLRLLGIDLVELVQDDLSTKNELTEKGTRLTLKLIEQGRNHPIIREVIQHGFKSFPREKVKAVLHDLRVELGIE